MTTFTLNSILESIRSDVQDVLRNVSDNDLRDMTAEEVCDLLDDNNYDAPEVIYYADAWEIVAGSSFNDYEAEYLDFSSCDNALDCIMLEARMIIDSVYYSERENIAQEVLEGLQENLSDESDEDNFVVEYLENGAVQYMYFYADNEDHAIEQFNDLFKDYDSDIKLVHCGYIVG